jgi:hypothetical protein
MSFAVAEEAQKWERSKMKVGFGCLDWSDKTPGN